MITILKIFYLENQLQPIILANSSPFLLTKIVVGTPLNLNSFTKFKFLSKKFLTFLYLRSVKNFFSFYSMVGASIFTAKIFKFLKLLSLDKD